MQREHNPVAESADRRGTILMVEDDADLREAQSLLLQQQGYLVFEAADGVQALAVLRRVRPDVIVLDLQMPHMTGWQFLERLRFHPTFHDIPVCVASGEQIDADLEVAAALRKPVSVTLLLETMRELCPPQAGSQPLRSLKR
jgi:CheY-like chemotaxis protein